MYFLHPYLSNFHQIYWYKLYLSHCHQPQTTSTEWHNQTKIIQISLLAWMYIFLIVLYLSRPIFTCCISMVHIDSNISNTNSYSRVSFEPENQVRCDRISRPDLCKVLIPIVLKLINFEDFLVFQVEDWNNLSDRLLTDDQQMTDRWQTEDWKMTDRSPTEDCKKEDQQTIYRRPKED